MGRSKFPGKPSKLATKKRVSVLAPPTIPGGGGAPSKSPPLVIGLTNKDNSPDSSSSSKSSGGLSTAAGLERIINPENVLSANKCSDVTGGGAIIAASVNAATSVNIRVAKVAHSEPLLLPKLPCPCQGVKSGEGCAKCAFNNNCGSVVGLGGNASSMEYGSGAGAASRGENLMSSHNFHNGDKPAQVTWFIPARVFVCSCFITKTDCQPSPTNHIRNRSSRVSSRYSSSKMSTHA